MEAKNQKRSYIAIVIANIALVAWGWAINYDNMETWNHTLLAALLITSIWLSKVIFIPAENVKELWANNFQLGAILGILSFSGLAFASVEGNGLPAFISLTEFCVCEFLFLLANNDKKSYLLKIGMTLFSIFCLILLTSFAFVLNIL